MANFMLSEWLEQIDPQMKQYATELEKFGFGSLKTLRNIDGDDISNYFPEMLPGHKKALLGEARKLRTPVKGVDNAHNSSQDEAVNTKRQRQLDFVNNNSSASNPSISVVVSTNDKPIETVSQPKKIRLDQESGEPSVPKTISDKEADLVMKLSKLEAEIEGKKEEINCFMLPIETLPNMGKMSSLCSNCHRKGHRAEGNKGKKDCELDTCKSYFVCGLKSKHPEYSRLLAQKKKELSNLKDSVGNVQEELDVLRKFVNKTSETNFMLDVKRRLRITDPKKYRDVAKLLRDTRTLKVAYKGIIPSADQDDSEEFPRLIRMMRHKIKKETGDFMLSDDDDNSDVENPAESVCTDSASTRLHVNSANRHQLQRLSLSETTNNVPGIHPLSMPLHVNDTWQGALQMPNTMPQTAQFLPPMPMPMQQQSHWFQQPLPLNNQPFGFPNMNPSEAAAQLQSQNMPTVYPNQLATTAQLNGEFPSLPDLPDLDSFLFHLQ